MNQADLWPNMPMMDGDRTIPCRCDRRIHVSKNHGREDWTRNEWRLFRAALLALELYALGAASSRTAGAFDYAYDPIGNRTSATEYDESGAPLFAEYAANSLNQYTQRTVPGYAAVRGEADTNAYVTVNERPVSRTGAYFHGGDYVDNTVSNLYADLEIYAAINPPGTNVPDTVYAVTSSVFVAKTPETFTYDADGNMTSDGRFTYTWNADNRMVMASNDAVVVTYAYDHRGRMVRKDIQRRGAEPQSIAYTWDGWNIIREQFVIRNSSFVIHNVWGLDLDGTLQGAGGVGGLLAVIRDDGVFLPTYDANGNITEYVTTNGTIAAHYDYSPFGEPLVASGPLSSTFTHRFSTKPWCSASGLVEYQMRKYCPDIGRWMSRDPIGIKGGPNIYAFASNCSLLGIDDIGSAPRYVCHGVKLTIALGTWEGEIIPSPDIDWGSWDADFGGMRKSPGEDIYLHFESLTRQLSAELQALCPNTPTLTDWPQLKCGGWEGLGTYILQGSCAFSSCWELDGPTDIGTTHAFVELVSRATKKRLRLDPWESGGWDYHAN